MVTKTRRTVFYYSVKFVIGKVETAETPSQTPVAPGEYFTAINVHNSTHGPIDLIQKQFAIALPSEKAGSVIDWITVEPDLKKDEAMEIDTADIRSHTGTVTQTNLLKGFVVIRSNVELDVVVVYTAAGRDRYVATIHTERVAPRKLTENWPP